MLEEEKVSAAAEGGTDAPVRGLRLVEDPEARPRPAPDPALKELLDDMQRRYRVQRERMERGPDDRDAA